METKILCQEPIPLPGDANTYCMLERGHTGEHLPLAVRPIDRAELTLIPNGCSVTETEAAWYLRVRKKNNIITIRVPKNDFYAAEITIDQIVETVFKNWRGVHGTNG